MSQKKVCLASDNWTPAHPLIIKAITEANEGYAPSYGADTWTEEAGNLIQKAFKSKYKVFIVPTGTGANIFALRLCSKAYESVICTDIAHIQCQESGAAEALVGCKLLTVPNKEGKITSTEIVKKLKRERAFGKHSTSPRVLSITQPTEVGTVYTLEELRTLAKLCKQENLLLHVDGRFFAILGMLKKMKFVLSLLGTLQDKTSKRYVPSSLRFLNSQNKGPS